MTTKKKWYYIERFLDTSNTNLVRQHVNVKALQEDILRGVKTLSEDSYCKHSGGFTQVSLAYAVALYRLLGEEGMKGKSFYINEGRSGYTLSIETFSGFSFNFHGVSCGYYGEGSRGASDILNLCQFNKEQVEKVFTKKVIKAHKRK